MITFGLNYDVKAEHAEEFLKITNDVLKLMPEMEGHVKTVLYSDVNKENSFLMYSEWEEQSQFTAFVKSEKFKSVQNMSMHMLENRPKHQIYETKKMGGR